MSENVRDGIQPKILWPIPDEKLPEWAIELLARIDKLESGKDRSAAQ